LLLVLFVRRLVVAVTLCRWLVPETSGYRVHFRLVKLIQNTELIFSISVFIVVKRFLVLVLIFTVVSGHLPLLVRAVVLFASLVLTVAVVNSRSRVAVMPEDLLDGAHRYYFHLRILAFIDQVALRGGQLDTGGVGDFFQLLDLGLKTEVSSLQILNELVLGLHQ
jgi:hypothetical protein